MRQSCVAPRAWNSQSLALYRKVCQLLTCSAAPWLLPPPCTPPSSTDSRLPAAQPQQSCCDTKLLTRGLLWTFTWNLCPGVGLLGHRRYLRKWWHWGARTAGTCAISLTPQHLALSTFLLLQISGWKVLRCVHLGFFPVHLRYLWLRLLPSQISSLYVAH